MEAEYRGEINNPTGQCCSDRDCRDIDEQADNQRFERIQFVERIFGVGNEKQYCEQYQDIYRSTICGQL